MQKKLGFVKVARNPVFWVTLRHYFIILCLWEVIENGLDFSAVI